jgi:O-antigen/teichoic acid export membrane protein
MLSRNLSNVAVTKALGTVALAQYAIGRFGEPVVVALRNSVSSVVLSEMVRKDREERGQALALWQRATVVNTIFLFPVAVLVVRYAQPLVVTVFGAGYRQAALIMQIYMLVVVRECFDFAPALRAVNRTRPLVESNVAAFVVGAIALAVLIPAAGVAGAMAAFVIASFTDATYLGWRTMNYYRVGLKDLVPWLSIGKTALAALVAGTLIVSSAWEQGLGFAGIVVSGCIYLAAFALLLLALRVPEAQVLLVWVKKLIARDVRSAHEGPR